MSGNSGTSGAAFTNAELYELARLIDKYPDQALDFLNRRLRPPSEKDRAGAVPPQDDASGP